MLQCAAFAGLAGSAFLFLPALCPFCLNFHQREALCFSVGKDGYFVSEGFSRQLPLATAAHNWLTRLQQGGKPTFLVSVPYPTLKTAHRASQGRVWFFLPRIKTASLLVVLIYVLHGYVVHVGSDSGFPHPSAPAALLSNTQNTPVFALLGPNRVRFAVFILFYLAKFWPCFLSILPYSVYKLKPSVMPCKREVSFLT